MRHVRARIFCWVLLWCAVVFLAATLWKICDRLERIEDRIDRPEREVIDHAR